MEFLNGNTVGIDLGTTFSTLAIVDNEGEPTPIPNEDDEVETASIILLAESKHVIVGPNRSRAAMTVFSMPGCKQSGTTVKLRGIDPAARYRVTLDNLRTTLIPCFST